jgi:DNA-binding GntR family transcriptional regulator
MKRNRESTSSSENSQATEAAQDIIYRWLKRHVLEVPRDQTKFLTEAEVCRAIGKSRTPVREAMIRLEADGLVQIIPKKGAYVAPITDRDVDSVMEARALIEGWCVARAAELSDRSSLRLDKLLERQKAMLSNPVAFVECDREFHRTIVQAVDNPVIARFYESLRDRQLRMGWHAIAATKERIGHVLAEHGAIVDALLLGDAVKARSAMNRHLSNTLGALRRPSVGARGLAALP